MGGEVATTFAEIEPHRVERMVLIDSPPSADTNGGVAFRQAKSIPDRLAALGPVPPLLVIFGAQDALISAASAKLFEAVPGARIEIIDGAGHSPMVETPDKTLDLIHRFLKNAQNP